MTLSRHFSLEEMVHSDTAVREGIPNQPDAGQIEQLRQLCTAVLDPLRDEIGRAIRVTSGYRGPRLNARIGGSPTSQHALGQAADIQAPGIDVLELFKTVVRLGLPYDQVIYEAQSASVRWVHVSHKAGANRGEIRVAKFDSAGKPVSYPLISASAALAMAGDRAFGLAAEPAYEEHADEPVAAPARRATTPTVPAKRTAAKKATAKKAAVKKAAVKRAPAQTTSAGAKTRAAGRAKPA